MMAMGYIEYFSIGITVLLLLLLVGQWRSRPQFHPHMEFEYYEQIARSRRRALWFFVPACIFLAGFTAGGMVIGGFTPPLANLGGYAMPYCLTAGWAIELHRINQLLANERQKLAQNPPQPPKVTYATPGLAPSPGSKPT
ncbi:hypothetical protein F3N42_08920 [Marinihelvus fidelis]|uniref:SdpI family protein n=1 Tax=Marinihelvus fidelis TaxID=2613842 RepID=A0A5N0T9I2_9GAMM|nr:hypothetical protein [Marinihelvus fidelis]KAA9131431.1 hypothetical protein F3N42_08920 [Marinihelvus fidelis]